MLIVQRRRGEEVVIDEGLIVLAILECTNQKVRLGFTAPKEIRIDRREIYEKRPAAVSETVKLRAIVELADRVRCAYIEEYGPCLDKHNPLEAALAALETAMCNYAMGRGKGDTMESDAGG